MALVATGVGALASAGALTASTAAGTAAATAITATATSVATYASLAAGLASIGAQVTAKKPPARGTINQVIVTADAPSPYIIGETYSGGVLRHDVGYGATLKKVPNPYRGQVIVYSVAGPVTELVAQCVDFVPLTFSPGGGALGYYATYLYRDFRLGLLTETALTPHWAGMPGWSAASKLSGRAAILWNGLFDKDGKRYASGWPQTGAIWKGVKCYDPRKDSTYPGGMGAHRWADPRDTAAFSAAKATWEYSECPGLHALKYALGSWERDETDASSRYQLIFGPGLPMDGVIVADFVELANVCDANSWKAGGVIYEPGSVWDNFKRIAEAGAAEPLWRGGRLGLKISAPRVSLYTVTEADLADEDAEMTGMQAYGARLNGIRPKYRSAAHKWDYVPSGLVSVPTYLEEDGEPKIEEMQWDFVQDKDQVAQLAAYRLVNGRELAPLSLPFKPHMRHFGPGDMLTFNLPRHGLEGIDAVILKRAMDPGKMIVRHSFMSETAAKHDFALGRIGTAPPTPALTSREDRDDIATEIVRGAGAYALQPASLSRSIGATSGGAIKAGQFPIDVIYSLIQDGEDVLSDEDVTLTLSTTGMTASLGGIIPRTLTISAMSGDIATATVTAFVGAGAVAAATVTLTKVRDGSSGNQASDMTITANNSGSYAGAQGGPISLSGGPGGQFSLYAYVPYTVSSGSVKLAGKVQYRTTPGSGAWTDVAPEVQDDFTAIPGEPSQLSLYQSIDAPTGAAETWEFQLLLRRAGGGSGTYAVTAGECSFVVSAIG